MDQKVMQQGSGGYATRILRLYNKDQEVVQQGPGGYTTRIRRLLAVYFWYRCYYPYRLRDALSPVCGIFFRAPKLASTLD